MWVYINFWFVLSVSRLKTLESSVNEVKQKHYHSNGEYAALMEEKDQEYKAELKNFLAKVRSHVEENSAGSHAGNERLLEEVKKKLKFVEQVKYRDTEKQLNIHETNLATKFVLHSCACKQVDLSFRCHGSCYIHKERPSLMVSLL